jgi:hypothetical protein
MEIQRADAKRRRQAIFMAVFALILGVVAIVMLQSWLTELRQIPIADTKHFAMLLTTVFAWSVSAACLVAVSIGLYLWRFGARVRATLQFPPPDTLVVRDTVVLRGSQARRRATLLQALAVALLFGAVCLLAVAWRLHSLLITHAA